MYKKTVAISFWRVVRYAEQKDLTEMARSAVTQKSYSQLPFKNAIKIVKGNGGKGKREFALFSDPDCPFCRRLEETLAGVTDYTAYVFMFPIKSLHLMQFQKQNISGAVKIVKKPGITTC